MKQFRLSFEFRVALIYSVLGILWILLSDRLVAALYSNPDQITNAQTFKAWGYVLLSGLLILFFLHREGVSRRKAENEFQSIFENAVEGIFQSTLDGRFIRVNHAMARLYGYGSPEEMITAVSDIGVQLYADADERKVLIDILLDQGVAEGFEGKNLRSDGSIFWTSTSARIVRDPQGKILYFEGFIQDITARKETEDALSAVEDRYRVLIEQIPAVVYIDNRKKTGEPYYLSPQIERLLGYTTEELVVDPYFWKKIIHPDDYDQVSDAYSFSKRTGERFDQEYRLITRDGRVIHVRDMATLVPGNEKGKSLWQGVIVDVNERRLTERIEQVIGQIAKATISTRTLEELYEFIHHALAGILPAQNFYIALYDPAANLVSFPYFVDQLDKDASPKPPRRGLTEYVMRTKEPLLASPEVFNDLFRRGEVESIGPASIDWLGVPLTVDGRVIGVMAVQSYAPGTRYTVREMNVLNLVSTQVAIAIERKRFDQTLQHQLMEMTVLNAATAACARASDMDDLIASVTGVISQTLYPDNCGVLLVDRSSGTWTPHPSYHGASPEKLKLRYHFGEGITGKVAANGKVIRLGNTRSDASYLESTAGIQSEVAVPIFVNGRVFGVINAESCQKDAFTEQDERLLATIAGSLSIAIEKIRLLHTEKQRRFEAEILREATVALSGPLDLAKRFEIILDYLAKFAPYDSATIALNDLGTYKIVAGRGMPQGYDLIGKRVPYNYVRDDFANNRQPLVLEDAQADARFENWPGADYIHGWLMAPLVAYDTVIGFLYLDSRKVGAFSQDQASFIQAFANQAAAAIENARLYEAEQSRRQENARLIDELQVYNLELSMAYDITLEGWGRALEMRDRETHGHTQRVTDLTLRIARRMGIPETEIAHVRRGVLLHDIGKIAISDQILKKPGPLDEDEWVEMRRHPQYAYDLLYPILYLRPALDIPYCHHEHWDGSGYPRGLKGEEIPLSARIFSVVDVWDAVLHDRPYLKAWSTQQALDYIKAQRGIQFDPRVVDVFLDLLVKETGL